MKRRQVTAFLLSAMMAVSVCFSAGAQAFAAEDSSIGISSEKDENADSETDGQDNEEEAEDASDTSGSRDAEENTDRSDEDEQVTDSESSEGNTSEESASVSDEQSEEIDAIENDESGSEDSTTDEDTSEDGTSNEEADAEDAVDEQAASANNTSAAPEETAEEMIEEEGDEASMAGDVSNNCLKPVDIAVNKEYTHTFEKLNDMDCFRFKSGGGSFKVKIWFKPGDMSDPDNYDLEKRAEMSYGLYGKWSLDGGAPRYAFGEDGIMTTELYTPNAFDVEGEDYTVSGDYVVVTHNIGKIASGKQMGLIFSGNYKGTYKFKVIGKAYVVRKSIKKATVTVASGTYSGKAVKPKVTVKLGNTTLKNGTDYKVTYSNNISIGSKAVAKVTGVGKYKDTVSKTFTIKRRSITNSVNITLKPTTCTYSGKAKKPTFSIYLPATNNIGSVSLVKNKDFTFKYQNNIEPGTGKLIVTGKGNYTGTAVRTFKINRLSQPATLKKTSLTINYNQVPTTSKLVIVDRKENARITYSSTNTKVATVKNGVVSLKGTGTATIKVVLAQTKHYSAKTLTYKVTVLKKQTITTGIADGAKVAYSSKPVPLKAVVKVGDGKLKYKSSDPNVVSVDSKGNLLFKDATKLGKAQITITASKTSTYAMATKTITITTVKGKPVLAYDKPVQTHYYNEAPFTLAAPTDEPVKLVYSSDKPECAAVSEDGIVTLNPGNIKDDVLVNITVQSMPDKFFNESDKITLKLDIIAKGLFWPVRTIKEDGTAGSSIKSINTHFGEYMTSLDRNHRGIDIDADESKGWFCPENGRLETVYYGCISNGGAENHKNCNPNHGRNADGVCNNGFGNGVIISFEIEGVKYYAQFAHMSVVNPDFIPDKDGNIKVNEGSEISRRTYLGNVGNRGFSFGVHAHFEINKNSAFGTNINNDPTSENCVFEYAGYNE